MGMAGEVFGSIRRACPFGCECMVVPGFEFKILNFVCDGIILKLFTLTLMNIAPALGLK